MIFEKIIVFLFFIILTECRSVEDFLEERNQIIEAEGSSYLGSDLILTDDELVANDYLMRLKISELDQAFINDDLPSSISFFKSKERIEASDVFKFIQGMPKGGALHLHEYAVASIDWVISNITYRENLYTCYKNETDFLLFGWYQSKPEDGAEDCQSWSSLAELRELYGAEFVDKFIKDHLSIVVENPEVSYPNINAVWEQFSKRFIVLEPLLNYQNIAKEYFYHAIQECYDDGVQYMEVRSDFILMCANQDSSDCQPLDIIDTARVFQEAADEFAEDHPDDWCGVRMIYAPVRKVTTETAANYIQNAIRLVEELPDFIIGFDLADQEDLGEPLIFFINELLAGLEQYPGLRYFFHSGETVWQGTSTDNNLIDALLLNTTRIGHGYAIAKHPEAKRMAIEKDVPIEVNPISNQVLGLVKDLRNHPAAVLIQEGFPMVISSDDPGLWDAKGLSYDYYSAFMALASKTMDLKLLKKLVLNSLHYSALEGEALERCNDIVQSKWESFVQSFV